MNPFARLLPPPEPTLIGVLMIGTVMGLVVAPVIALLIVTLLRLRQDRRL